ncbi:MAG: FAD-binding and (Fe-S)-binding domain-containing protein [Spirosomataceae bacterium]|jgi:D-lactate dehydrogenase
MEISENLKKIIEPERVRDSYIDRVSFASDAGFYYLVPEAVVHPNSEKEIQELFNFSQNHKIPLVFRAGGTSLSGQSITDGILVEIGRFWKKISVEKEANLVRVQPGITGLMTNLHLKKYNKKIGPDPSSINAAMMGGIISNNASGMCCGVGQNSYHTIEHIRFILPDGKIYTTENKEDYRKFEFESAELFKTINEIRNQILGNSELKQKIRAKYKTKNTVGYSLNSFIDFEHPLDIFAHLLVGGEGTLGFISEAVMQTVPDYPYKSTGLLYFNDIYTACQAIIPLRDCGALMVELMDRASLRAVQDLNGMPEIVKTLPDTAAALLVEFQENTPEQLTKMVAEFEKIVPDLGLIQAPDFTLDPIKQAFYWKVRKGLFPAVGAVRASGTTVILEDIAFPISVLGDAIIDIQSLFKKYNYHDAIIFGHAKDGNIHFVVTQTLNTTSEIHRYDNFLREVVDLVVKKYDGSLKAEHGTGRNMAPFVETEWGTEAFQIMKRLKAVVDPLNLLNPGVIINQDSEAHIKHLKQMPTVEAEVDRCIECGFCEPSCPSKDLTASPRRRIVIRRVLENLKSQKKHKEFQLLAGQFDYVGLDTCAVDGLCAVNCPVEINTGDLVKKLRVNAHSKFENFLADQAAQNFGVVLRLVRSGVKMVHFFNSVLGENFAKNFSASFHKFSKNIPVWSNQINTPPKINLYNTRGADSDFKIVYFPSCISRMMGTYKNQPKNILETFYSICEKSNISIKVLEGIEDACCSQIFSSKGFKNAYDYTANSTFEKMWCSSENGKYPIVIDVTSCQYTLKNIYPVLSLENKEKFKNLKVLDSVEFIHQYVLPVLNPVQKKGEVVLHPVCSLQKLKTESKFMDIANHFAAKVTVPLNAGCCGMAGDRGFLVPELTRSATKTEASEVKNISADFHYSSSITCEINMSESTGKDYESILYLIDSTT